MKNRLLKVLVDDRVIRYKFLYGTSATYMGIQLLKRERCQHASERLDGKGDTLRQQKLAIN